MGHVSRACFILVLSTIFGTRVDATVECKSPFSFSYNKCVLNYTRPISWNEANRLCQAVGGDLPSVHGTEGTNHIARWSWLGLKCEGKGKEMTKWTDGKKIELKQLKDGSCERAQCLLLDGHGRIQFKSCNSRFQVTCVHKPWHYRGKCPSNYFHVGDKCFIFLPGKYYKSIKSVDLNRTCASIRGARNGKVGKIESANEHAALTIMMQQRRVSSNLLSYVSASYVTELTSNDQIDQSGSPLQIYGSESLAPGFIGSVNDQNKPSFFGLVCMSKRIISPDDFGNEVNSFFPYFGEWSRSDCPLDYFAFDDAHSYCYKEMTEPKRRTEALEMCKKEGANLISITNEVDQSIARLLRLRLQSKGRSEMLLGLQNYSNGILAWSDGRHSTYKAHLERSDRGAAVRSGMDGCFVMKSNGKWRRCYPLDPKPKPFYCAKRRSDARSELTITRCLPAEYVKGSNDSCIVIGGNKYFTRSSCHSDERLAHLKSREVTKILIDLAQGYTNIMALKSNRSSFYDYSGIRNAGKVFLNPSCFMNQCFSSPSRVASICEKTPPPTSPTVKPSDPPKKAESALSNNVVWILIGVIVFMVLLFALVGGLCWYCNCRRVNTSASPASDNMTETISLPPKVSTASASKPPAVAPKPKPASKVPPSIPSRNPAPAEEQGIFEEEYELLDN